MQPALTQLINSLYISLAAFALGKALFRSFWATEFKNRMLARDKQAHARMAILQWELQRGAKYSADLARNKPHAAKVDLTTDELDARRTELQGLVGATIWKRAMMYFLGCIFCQSFWAGLIITVCSTASLNLIDPLIAGTVGFLLAERPVLSGPAAANIEPAAGCPTCGKNNHAATRSMNAAAN